MEQTLLLIVQVFFFLEYLLGVCFPARYRSAAARRILARRILVNVLGY